MSDLAKIIFERFCGPNIENVTVLQYNRNRIFAYSIKGRDVEQNISVDYPDGARSTLWRITKATAIACADNARLQLGLSESDVEEAFKMAAAHRTAMAAGRLR